MGTHDRDTQTSSPRAPARIWRVTLAMSCLSGGFGAAMPFLPIWLKEQHHLTGPELAIVMSGAVLLRVLHGPPLAAWADTARDRRRPIQILAGLSFLLYLIFGAVEGFLALALLGFVLYVFVQSVGPLLESAMLRAARDGPIDYGVARSFTSVAFIIGNILGGYLVRVFGPEAALYWAQAGMLATFLAALWIQADPAPGWDQPRVGVRRRLREAMDLLGQPAMRALLIATCAVQSAHAFYYGFGSIVWREQGVSADLIGYLWAFGVLAEIGFLATSRFWLARLGPEKLILIGCLGAVLRWAAMALSPPLWLLWPLQALHALTFAAAHVGAMKILHDTAPESQAGTAQTLYAAIAAGGTVMGFAQIASGGLHDAFGAAGYASMALLAALGLPACFTLLRLGRRAPPA